MKQYKQGYETSPTASAFPVGYSIHPETRGLWIWSDILLMCLDDNNRSSTHMWRDARQPDKFVSDGEFNCPEDRVRTVVFCDTEGLHSPGVDEISDAKMFAISFLLSTEMIFNSVKLIDQQQVEYLELLTRRSALFGLRSFATSSSSDHSLLGSLLQPPNLSWTVQDFVQDLGGRLPTEWLRDLLGGTPTERFISPPHDSTSTHLPLGSMFAGIDAQTFPPPVFSGGEDGMDSVGMTQQLDKVNEDHLYPPYREAVANYSHRLMDRIVMTPKTKDEVQGGGYFSGADVAHLLEFLVTASSAESIQPGNCGADEPKCEPVLSQLFPQVPSVWDQYDKLQNSLIISDLVADYSSSMDSFQQQAVQSSHIGRRLNSAAVAHLYFGPTNLDHLYTAAVYSRGAYTTRRLSIVKGQTENAIAPKIPFPREWFTRWSSIGLGRILSLMKHHIKASGVAVPENLQQALKSQSIDDIESRHLLRLLLSEVVQWCPSNEWKSNGIGEKLYVQLKSLSFSDDLFHELKSREELNHAWYSDSVTHWCEWTREQVATGLEWFVDDIKADPSITWSTSEVSDFERLAPPAYQQFWKTVTNYPGEYLNIIPDDAEVATSFSQLEDYRVSMNRIMNLPLPQSRNDVCTDQNLPPYSVPNPVDVKDLKSAFTSSNECYSSMAIIRDAAAEASGVLSTMMDHRRGSLLWDTMHRVVAPVVDHWCICLKSGINLYEWDMFGELFKDPVTDTFEFATPPPLDGFFETCYERSGSAKGLLQRYRTIDDVMSAFSEKMNAVVGTMSILESDERFRNDPRPKNISDWMSRSVFPALRETLLQNWEMNCLSEGKKLIDRQMQRFESSVKTSVSFPSVEEDLRQVVARETATSRESLDIELENCTHITNHVISKDESVGKKLNQMVDEALKRSTEHLEHANLIAIRSVAGEPLKRLFVDLTRSSHGLYVWSRFLDEAYRRAEEVIRSANIQNSGLWSNELMAKVSRMSVEEMVLPLGVEGSHFSHSSQQFLQTVDDEFRLYDHECSGVLWYDLQSHMRCSAKVRDGASGLLKGKPYVIIEDNQFKIIEHFIFIIAFGHAVLSLIRTSGSPILSMIFPNSSQGSCWLRMIGGPMYGSNIDFDSRTGHKKNGGFFRCQRIPQFTVIVMCSFYAFYCLVSLAARYVGDDTEVLVTDIPNGNWYIYIILKYGGSLIDSLFWFVLLGIRKTISSVAIFLWASDSIVGEMNGVEVYNRIWYSAGVYWLSVSIWSTFVLWLPHVLIDDWRALFNHFRLRYIPVGVYPSSPPDYHYQYDAMSSPRRDREDGNWLRQRKSLITDSFDNSHERLQRYAYQNFQ
eukprot:GHVH01000855.1.p1 GENE.GHVH01000855.1~~GHVH01000855.1.p1  ORF type:complete len:1428 (+),score=218.60 GHVH01000855.1:299-4285(+)